MPSCRRQRNVRHPRRPSPPAPSSSARESTWRVYQTRTAASLSFRPSTRVTRNIWLTNEQNISDSRNSNLGSIQFSWQIAGQRRSPFQGGFVEPTSDSWTALSGSGSAASVAAPRQQRPPVPEPKQPDQLAQSRTVATGQSHRRRSDFPHLLPAQFLPPQRYLLECFPQQRRRSQFPLTNRRPAVNFRKTKQKNIINFIFDDFLSNYTHHHFFSTRLNIFKNYGIIIILWFKKNSV